MPITKKEYIASIEHDKKAVDGRPYNYSKLPSIINVSNTLNHAITVECPMHGEWTTRTFSHKKNGCRECGSIRTGLKKRGRPSHRRMTLKEILSRIKSTYKDRYDLSKIKTYESPNTILSLGCSKHGTFKTRAFNALWEKSKDLCPSCISNSHKIRTKSSSKVAEGKKTLEEAAIYMGYTVVSHTHSHEPVVLNCTKHGNFSIKRAFYVTQLQAGCPVCRQAASLEEELLASKLEKTFRRVERNVRSLLKNTGLELDLFLPDKKIGIEINGVYWHDKDLYRKRHREKAELAKSVKIRLLQFTDLEIRSKLELVVSMINAKAGIFTNRLYARELGLIKVETSVARKFYDTNHIQGFCGATWHLGLEDEKGTIKCIASFSKARFAKDADWELIRFATLQNTQVVGGLSRLISLFCNKFKGKLVSYADLRYSQGEAYEKNGFTLVRKTRPNYVYVKGKTIISRVQAQKHKLADLLDDFDPLLSETNNMKRNGYFRVFDAGNLVYVKNM